MPNQFLSLYGIHLDRKNFLLTNPKESFFFIFENIIKSGLWYYKHQFKTTKLLLHICAFNESFLSFSFDQTFSILRREYICVIKCEWTICKRWKIAAFFSYSLWSCRWLVMVFTMKRHIFCAKKRIWNLHQLNGILKASIV